MRMVNHAFSEFFCLAREVMGAQPQRVYMNNVVIVLRVEGEIHPIKLERTLLVHYRSAKA